MKKNLYIINLQAQIKLIKKELKELFKLYPTLEDLIEVEVCFPTQFNNKVTYF